MDTKLLLSFLDEHRVNKTKGTNEPYTHASKTTSARGPKALSIYAGSYFIPDSDMEKFWTLYCNVVNKGIYCTITERPGPYGPLRVDFDFKSAIDDGVKRKYTKEIIKEIINFYQEEIKNIVKPEVFKPYMLYCIVLEKPSPRIEEGCVKDGFHLHFPYFICEGWIQDDYLRNHVTERMISQKIWENVNMTTPISSVIDRKMAKKVWMLYGSMNCKNSESRPYMYNRWKNESEKYGMVYDENLNEVSLGSIFQDHSIFKNNEPNRIKYYIPRLLTIRGYKSPTEIKEEITRKKPVVVKNRKTVDIARSRDISSVLEDIKFIQDNNIMDMISPLRADNYELWMDVGWTLFNIGEGHEITLQLWIEFSKQSTKFSDGECEDLWATMELKGKSIASLLAMAKIDSPEKYLDMKSTTIRFLMWESLKEKHPNEYDVCKVIYGMYGERFLCASSKPELWYEFIDHRWRIMDDSITLRLLLAENVVKEYSILKKEINDRISDIEFKIDIKKNDDISCDALKTEHKNYQVQKSKVSNIITALKTVSFQEKVIKMCKIKMYDHNFLSKLNENRMLIGCENGVLDLELGIFRDGRQDDYISFSTGIHYTKFSEEDDEVLELNDLLEKVFTNPNLRKYFIDFFTSCLQGGNINKRFLVGTGWGDNAKSVMFLLLEKTFGTGNNGYYGKFPRESLIRGRGSSGNSAHPELARVRGKRIMGTQEIAVNEELNIGFIKEATGNDSFFARSLFEKGTEINPMFTLVMQCNKPPKVPGHDAATWTRIRVLSFDTKFVKPQDLKEFPVPESKEDQIKMKRFMADPEFSKKIPTLSRVLLWKLFENYKIYKKTGLYEPKEVIDSTNIYKIDNDVYMQFINDKIEKIKDRDIAKTNSISLPDVHAEFKEWFTENYPSYKKDSIGKSTFRDELTKRLGGIKKPDKIYGFVPKGGSGSWMGYKLIHSEENDIDVVSIMN